MKSNYKRLGDYIVPCDEKNTGNIIKKLQGISNQKYFQKSHTNTIGVDLEKYRIVRTGQFAFNRATTRNGDKISIALRQGGDCIVSPSYRIFKSKDENVLNSEYLMMWFKRPEFDRFARFKSHGSAHEFFDYGEMCEVELPIPPIDKQLEIVKEYNTIQNRIVLNNQLISKIEETAQAIYKQWFVGGIDERITIEELFNPKKGRNITRENAIEGLFPVVAGGLEPSCYHNDHNTSKPVITISASGANAGFVRLYHTEVWAADCSFIDQNIFKEVYFAYVCLKVNQSLLMSKQEGTGQPHIYPEHIVTIPINGFNNDKLKLFNNHCEPIFNRVAIVEKETQKLEELTNLLLAKMTRVL